MKIFAVDDTELIRRMLDRELHEACPDADITVFENPEKLLEHALTEDFDVVFCDVRMPHMDGITLAQKIREAKPKANIIFLTAYPDYAVEAIHMHASGYIQKPLTKEKILAELGDLRYRQSEDETDGLQYPCRIQCYGNFEIFGSNGLPVHFRRSKSKETLAYLVHRKGAVCTTRELAAILFEDMPYDVQKMRYLQKIISSLMHDLEEAGCCGLVLRRHGNLMVDVCMANCDYYENPRNIYETGEEYMAQYSWAETF